MIVEENDMGYIVRRLTPLECTRLQGYPDGWIFLPEKKTMTDDEFEEWNSIRKRKAEIMGKQYRTPKNKEAMVSWYNKMISSDSNLYKSLGNSIALPQWLFLMERIKEFTDEGVEMTLGSLFDGIGGFPLCWELVNGTGTALWASEIEEFPIAVTKVRFPDGE